MPPWQMHQSLNSNYQTRCSRCTLILAEAANVEVFAINGEGYFSLCHQCFGDFVLFINNQEVTMNSIYTVYGSDEDMDIAMHHPACACIECTLFVDEYCEDADAIVKSWKEDSYIFESRIEKTA